MSVICPFIATSSEAHPDTKAHGANMGPIWGRQNPGGPHVGPMNFAIWDRYRPYVTCKQTSYQRFYKKIKQLSVDTTTTNSVINEMQSMFTECCPVLITLVNGNFNKNWDNSKPSTNRQDPAVIHLAIT